MQLQKEMTNIALLIDADNSPSKFIQEILTELANYGKVNIRKAYGNWTSSNLKGWEKIIQDHAIQPIQQYDLTKGKNATDIALTIDAMDILYTKSIDAFCIVSSDCDFTPLVTRIISEGKIVIGYGQRKAPSVFVNACSKFLYLDDEKKQKIKGPKENKLQKDKKLINLLKNAVKTTEDESGWSKLSRVGTLISNHASFDSRNYGFTRLSELIEETGLFNLKKEGTQLVVKLKKT